MSTLYTHFHLHQTEAELIERELQSGDVLKSTWGSLELDVPGRHNQVGTVESSVDFTWLWQLPR